MAPSPFPGDPDPSAALPRVVGIPGAILLGLGSILGTGVFLSLGLAAGAAGVWVVPATLAAALLALCNGLSSAQLAAAHPVSGGTYEYGHRWLGPDAGFVAGWMFLWAKSASAATAALGFGGYLLTPVGISTPTTRIGVGLVLVLALTAVVAAGLRRSHTVNAVLVAITVLGLTAFVIAGIPSLGALREAFVDPTAAGSGPPPGLPGILEGTALLFVAYTGYGRIATLGEEVRNPARSIPLGIVWTLALTAALYLSVTAVAVAAVGAGGLAEATRNAAAPLEVVAATFRQPGLTSLVGIAALTAMAGVLLNLLLGLSRVLLAMARRDDMPRPLARIRPADGTRPASPATAVWTMGAWVAALVCLGDIGLTWSFSAFTVLVYYALTNLAALRLAPEDRQFSPWVSALGLVGCLGLAFWVEATAWAAGSILLVGGLAGRRLLRRRGDGRRP